MAKKDHREGLLFVDATPNADYPIRILEAHLFDKKFHWRGTPDDNPVIVEMNRLSKQRDAILRMAIGLLRNHIADLELAAKERKPADRRGRAATGRFID